MYNDTLLCRVYSREAEYVADGTEDVTEELDELRRSFSARLRSESLQRQSDNLEKDCRIQQLENILKLQLQREKTKDQKIAELEERVEAIAPLNESRCRELKEEWTSAVFTEDKDMAVESQMERAGANEDENEDRIYSNTSQASTSKVLSWESEDEPTCSGVKAKDKRHEEDDKETPAVHGQRLTNRQTSHRIKIPFLSKLRKSSQSKV